MFGDDQSIFGQQGDVDEAERTNEGVVLYVPCIYCQFKTRLLLPWKLLTAMISGARVQGGRPAQSGYELGVLCSTRGCPRRQNRKPTIVRFGQEELMRWNSWRPRGL